MSNPSTMSNRRSVYADRLREFSDFAFGDDEVFARRGRWRGYFRDRIGPTYDGRVILEIGCADGAFVSRIAAQHQNAAFIGLDWKAKAVYDGARRVAEEGLRNVTLLRGRAQDIRKIFADAELDEIWVFHPDPCDRDADLKNRLIAPPFLADVHHVLRDHSSTLTLKTDHPSYYQWVLALLGLPEPDWSQHSRTRTRDLIPAESLPPASDKVRRMYDVVMNSANYWTDPAAQSHTAGRAFAGLATTYESRFMKKRLPIYFIELRKK
jgi:tRNA G46 methylase TrmB